MLPLLCNCFFKNCWITLQCYPSMYVMLCLPKWQNKMSHFYLKDLPPLSSFLEKLIMQLFFVVLLIMISLFFIRTNFLLHRNNVIALRFYCQNIFCGLKLITFWAQQVTMAIMLVLSTCNY